MTSAGLPVAVLEACISSIFVSHLALFRTYKGDAGLDAPLSCNETEKP